MRRLLLPLLLLTVGCSKPADRPVVIGAKKFTESIVLAEMGTQIVRDAGVPSERSDLGSTLTVWLALTNGDIDAYPEYTGTIRKEILKADAPDLDAALAPFGVKVSKSLGYHNNYALGMRKDVAAAKGITKTSDLKDHPDLRCGFIPEFLDRADGWPGLKRHYALPQRDVQGMVHTLAYRALVEKAIDVTEVYTTDGEIAQYDLLVLPDDRNFFPDYETVWLYRADLERRHPAAVAGLRRLEGTITEERMQRMNSAVQREHDRRSEGEVAAEFLRAELAPDAVSSDGTLAGRLLATTWEHLQLVLPSLALAVLAAVPLGVLAARRPLVGKLVLAGCGLLQTIPSLALLLFMIPVMMWAVGKGTGAPPAVAALFLYSLLPIVRNTHAGLTGIAASLRESAAALGLPPFAALWRVELPLAAPTILAGVRTAAVINVGTATLGGFIGAGGYGRPILRGLDKDDLPLMLEGAIPAAILALAIEGLFGLIERSVTRRG